MAHKRPIVILVPHNGMGHAEGALPRILIQKYLSLVDDEKHLPEAICLYTEGVKLATEESPALELLRGLEAMGVRIIICSTCLNHFGLSDQVKVGTVGSMADIQEAQWTADKVITI